MVWDIKIEAEYSLKIITRNILKNTQSLLVNILIASKW